MTTMVEKPRTTLHPTPGQSAAPPGILPRTRRDPRNVFVHIALLSICAAFLLPFIWMLSTSLKPLDQAMEFPPRFIPRTIPLYHHNGASTPLPQNYFDVITSDRFDFPRFSRNTLIVAFLCVTGTLISSSLVAYGFARIDFRGRSVLFALMLSTMMIPFPVLMVSLFSIFRFLGDHTPIQFLGTFKPLWIGSFFGSAFNVFLLRQFFMTIPVELSDAARIDGCSEFAIFWRIVLPLSRPALIVVALFTFMAAWNDFLGPLVYLQRPEQYTLALGLQAFQSQHGGTPFNQLMAASVLIITPVIVLFFLAQKTFVQGIATTGLKG
jgi:multiple sugar transport system permease protein